MKKYQYIVALACVLVGAVGFSSIYLTNQAQEREAELARQQQVKESQQLELASEDKISEEKQISSNQVADADLEPNIDKQNEIVDDPLADKDLEMQKKLEEQQIAEGEDIQEPETAVGTIVEEKITFHPENGLVWPIEGSVLLDYSMESTIFFPTLQQYQYNPAMILSGNVNDKVYFIARGRITNIETNEVTGCTVTQDIGDGYTAIYGQLKELNFKVGDIVESGQVVGYVSEPTKYYSVEGTNVYFQLLKDGLPVDPEEILP
jgi:septal ring factor EnvC (AmiA/AmiB activator)